MNTMIPLAHSKLDAYISNTLTYALDFYHKETFYISDNRDEEIFIFHDNSEINRGLLKRYQEQHPNRPTIIISRYMTSDNSNHIILRPPISVKSINKGLQEAADKLISTTDTQETEILDTPKKHKLISGGKNTAIEHDILSENDPKFKATREDINLNNVEALSRLVYKADDYLQGKLHDLFTKKTVTSLNTPYGFITYFPDKHKINTDLSSKTIETFSSIPCNRKGDFIESEACFTEENNADNANSCVDSLLWKAAIHASRGRLPESTDIDSPFRIKNWPNYTRLMIIPHSMEILSLWALEPISLRETLQVSKIPQRYVFSLYSALHAINLLEFNTHQEISLSSTPSCHDTHEQLSNTEQHKGLIGKLLSHIAPEKNKKENIEEEVL